MEIAVILIIFGLILYLLYLSSGDKILIFERVGGLILAGVSLLFVLSIATFSEENPLTNLGGIVGHHVAKYLIKSLGYIISSYLCLFLFTTSLLTFLNRLKKSLVIDLSALFVILFAISIYLPVPLAGSISLRIGGMVNRYLGIAGKVILSVILMVLAGLVLELPSILKKKAKPTPSEEPLEEKAESNVKEEVQRERKVTKKQEKQKPGPIPTPSKLDPYKLISLLRPPEPFDATESKQELEKNKQLIEEKLREFEIEGKVVNYYPGPVVTRYEYEPAPGIKLSRIANLADDLALRIRSNAIRIVAPLPNKGLVGFEIPNKHRKTVYLRALVEREEFFQLESPLAFALGVDTAGNPVYADLGVMPHLLIAGSTGSGKSVCINTIITSLILRNSPDTVRFIFIDPKRIELSLYEGIPHLLLPVVKDRKLAVEVLKNAVKWMDYRYQLFAKEGSREIKSYNEKAKSNGGRQIPYIVIIIDEFADLIISTGREIEEPLARLAQMARAVGIHLVVATQRPSVDVITGTIKANFPVRIAFKVPSKVDSKTILDEKGAEKLLGRGDMLFIPPGSSEPVRLHGPLVTENETHLIAKELVKSHLTELLRNYFELPEDFEPQLDEFIEDNLHIPLIRKDEPGLEELENRTIDFLSSAIGVDKEEIKEKIEEIRANYYKKIPELEEIPVEVIKEEEIPEGEWDPMLEEAAKVVVLEGKASATLLQRKLKLGFARAARVIDQLEEIGVIGPQEGTKPRKVLVKLDELDRIFENLRKDK